MDGTTNTQGNDGQTTSATQGAANEGAKTNTNNVMETTPKGSQTEGEKRYTDAEVDAILGKKFAEWEKKQAQKVTEATKLGEMNAQEKAEYERDRLQEQLEELTKKNTLAEMTKTARGMLSDEGINVSDDLLSVLVSPDAEQTKTAVQSFIELFNSSVEHEVKERLKGNAPKAGTKGSAATMSMDDIMRIKDPVERQKQILNNKHLFGL